MQETQNNMNSDQSDQSVLGMQNYTIKVSKFYAGL